MHGQDSESLAENAHPANAPSKERAPGPASPGDEMQVEAVQEQLRLQLREEELVAEKRLVQLGVVRIRRQVVTELRTIEVEVLREEMTIEHLPLVASGADELEDAPGSQLVPALAERLRALQLGETLRLPIVEEEVLIHKRPIVSRELVIDKRLVEEVRRLSDTVRREDALITYDLDSQPDVGDQAPVSDVMAGRNTTSQTNAASARQEGPVRADLQDADQTLELREEQLRVHTQVVESGAVQVRTGVVSEQKSLVVRVKHEETTLQQVAVQIRPADRLVGSGEDVFDIPEYGEQVSLRNETVVTEEITLDKKAVQDVKLVTAEVRREVADIQIHGDVPISSAERRRDHNG